MTETKGHKKAKSQACPICKKVCHHVNRHGGFGYHMISSIAGIEAAEARDPFTLFECKSCKFKFMFKLPFIGDDRLMEYYTTSDDRAIEPSPNLSDSAWPKSSAISIASYCEQIAMTLTEGRRVLEVGCSNGETLQRWQNQWIKSGIEPCESSAMIAQKRGINIIAKTILIR